MRFLLSISTILLFFELSVNAQQLPHFRNNSFNLFSLNPAASSIKEIPEIMIDHRAQWTGFSGAPRISTISGKYMFREDMGAGAYIMSDRYGITQKLDFHLNYVYKIPTDYFDISFGLAWTLTQFKLLSTQISTFDSYDIVLNQTLDDKTWKPDADAGIMIVGENYYAGFAVLQLFKTKYVFFDNTNNVPGLIRDERHYFFTGGYNISDRHNTHSFTPTLNLYFAKGTPFKFDIIANYTYKSSFLTSLNLSKGDALVFTAGYKYDRYVFTYSFDIITSRIRNVSSGAHEICLGIYLYQKQTNNNDHSSPMF
ncbi:MAG: PorP/SprF family type IX secretion system membrane protein [Bacteroidales bacterium]|nr:PorP/SprF family type IX secretion system membrane protein [Bacteroidales bacterium]